MGSVETPVDWIGNSPGTLPIGRDFLERLRKSFEIFGHAPESLGHVDRVRRRRFCASGQDGITGAINARQTGSGRGDFEAVVEHAAGYSTRIGRARIQCRQ
jgi:hypothetical protein